MIRLRAALAEPEALIVALACALSGANSLLHRAPPSLAGTLPGWLRTAWAVVLLVGGLARMIGLLSRWIRLDAAGAALLGPAGLIYGVALLSLAPAGVVAGLIVMAIGGGCLARLYQYWRLARGPADLGRRR